MIGDSPAARTEFILAHTKMLPVPHAPEISLHVADDSTALWLKTEEELGKMGLPPPFWAFAWAGGQALARYILDHPDIVRGKSVLDFASGSGLVAIAAALAGARQVQACDIDPFAAAAIAINAKANGVIVTPVLNDLTGTTGNWDVVLAGDVSYERDMAQTVTEWLEQLNAGGATVLMGDPGRSYLARDRLESIATYSVPVSRDLEDSEVKKSSVWKFRARGTIR
ncbi:MAG: methyltransferase [Hyphomicrobiales bacterium]|nr:methyltransferase [Hyphomicrobiales bacterium]